MRNSILYDPSSALPDIAGHCPRGRIDRLLREGLKHRLVTVTAGPGWGKTQAVSAFFHRAEADFLWLRLTETDNLTDRFWSSFVHASGLQYPLLKDRLTALEFPSSAALFSELLQIFAQQPGTERLALVFDDFHHITEPTILEFFERLLITVPEGVTFLFIGRSIPRWPSGSIPSEPMPITRDDLRFTAEEEEAFFAAQGLTLPSAAALAQLEGWPVALYLASLSLRRGRKERDLPNPRRGLFRQIEREIFARYPAELRHILVQLSLFPNIPADLMQVHPVLSDTANNFLVRFNPVHRTYDLHILFLEFLQKKQESLPEPELRDAHRQLARWYDSHGFPLDSLPHYEISGDFAEIWSIISRYEVTMPSDIADLFLGLIARFPAELAERYPLIPVVHARLLLNNGRLAESEAAFLSLIAAAEQSPDDPACRSVAGESYLFLAMISLLSFDDRFIDYYKRADMLLPRGSTLIDGRLTFSQGNYMLLVRDPSAGSLARHVDGVMEAMPYAVRAMNGAARGVKYVTRGEAAYYTCDMKDAELSAYKAIYQAELDAQYDTICAAYFVLLRVYFCGGHSEKAAACLQNLQERIQNTKNPDRARNSIYSRDMMTGWYYARLGDFVHVPDWMLRQEKRERILPPNSLGRDPLIRAYCLLCQEQYYELGALIEALEEVYEARGLLLARLEVQIFKAVAAQKLGDLSQAMSALDAAYHLAAPNRLFMPFIELGKHMRALIYAAKRSEECRLDPSWLDEIHTKSATYEKRLKNIRDDYARRTHRTPLSQAAPLTGREQEVLRHLCQGLTSEEIAQNLYVSTSTIKKSLSAIYAKLGASNRAEAVRIAMQREQPTGN